MKRIFTLILYLVYCKVSFGQEIQIKRLGEDDTWNNLSRVEFDSIYFDLSSIKESCFHSHFRIYLPSQIIEVFSKDGVVFQGELINHVFEQGYDADSEIGKHYARKIVFQKVELNTDEAGLVAQNLINSNQIDFPTDTQVTHWNFLVFHGNSIVFELNISGRYKYQEYFMPSHQGDSIAFLKRLNENINNLHNDLHLEYYYNYFVFLLPGGRIYSKNGGALISKVYEYDNGDTLKLNREVYLRFAEKVIDSYLMKELGQKSKGQKNLLCLDFVITIGKNGKLKSVDLTEYDSVSLIKSFSTQEYIEEKREVRKCRKIIKETFREIDLSFLNLKYEISRIVKFRLDGRIQIGDESIEHDLEGM